MLTRLFRAFIRWLNTDDEPRRAKPKTKRRRLAWKVGKVPGPTTDPGVDPVTGIYTGTGIPGSGSSWNNWDKWDNRW